MNKQNKSRLLVAVLLIGALAASGCAGHRKLVSPDADTTLVDDPPVNDPLEGFNRRMFDFNDFLDRKLLRPAAQGYRNVVPTPVRRGIGNFFRNLLEPTNVINNLLQGKPEQAVSDLWRFIMNSTIGVIGFRDVATAMGLERHQEDFGQTFAVWGFGSGPYLVLPFLGPSNVRDGLGLIPYYVYTDPRLIVEDTITEVALISVNVVDTRAQLLSTSRVLELQLDPYVFTREAVRQRRLDLIHDGNPPLPDNEFQ
ncbi:MAG: VacJ family lipoprotein [Gammaproteobacteria bacterium]|nr:VacJ family lipoprotein [Gammaproteobacteria bacterium]